MAEILLSNETVDVTAPLINRPIFLRPLDQPKTTTTKKKTFAYTLYMVKEAK